MIGMNGMTWKLEYSNWDDRKVAGMTGLEWLERQEHSADGKIVAHILYICKTSPIAARGVEMQTFTTTS